MEFAFAEAKKIRSIVCQGKGVHDSTFSRHAEFLTGKSGHKMLEQHQKLVAVVLKLNITTPFYLHRHSGKP